MVNPLRFALALFGYAKVPHQVVHMLYSIKMLAKDANPESFQAIERGARVLEAWARSSRYTNLFGKESHEQSRTFSGTPQI